MSPKAPQPTEQELQEAFTLLGKKLAFLLAAANMPEEAKTAWASLIPQMSLEQVERLAGILEKEVSGQSEEFMELRETLGKVKKKYEAQKQKAADDALQEFQSIEKQL